MSSRLGGARARRQAGHGQHSGSKRGPHGTCQSGGSCRVEPEESFVGRGMAQAAHRHLPSQPDRLDRLRQAPRRGPLRTPKLVHDAWLGRRFGVYRSCKAALPLSWTPLVTGCTSMRTASGSWLNSSPKMFGALLRTLKTNSEWRTFDPQRRTRAHFAVPGRLLPKGPSKK